MKKIILILAVIICGNIVWASDAQMFKLDNGQTVVIQEVHNNPIVIIDTWIKTGSIDEDDTNNGVAHFLEHLFFKGTKNHAPGEFDRILETKGAITNAATSKDFTHYYVTIPSKDFDLALELHADMLSNPMIPRNEMEKERKVVLEEINKDLKSPTRMLQENLNTLMYTNHPYKRKVIGKSEIIETITREGVLDFYNKHYSPSNMVTVIIGDVNTNQALEKVKEVFNCEYKKQSKAIYPKENPLSKQQKKVEYIKTESGYMVIGFRGVPISDSESYTLDVLATILGEGRSSLLNQVLKEKKRLAFSVESGNSTMKDDGIFYITTSFVPEKCKAVQDAIFAEIEKIQKNGVTDDQLQLAKNIIERDTYYARESITNIATEIGYTIALTNDIKFYDNYLNNIKNVSKEAVKKAANKYLGADKSAISIILPENSKEIPVANVQNQGTATLISSNNDTQKYQLSNGSTLLYTPNSVNDIIAISIHAKGGQLLDKISGTAKLTAATMLKGTKNYSPVELSQVLEDNGIKIDPSATADAFSINVLTTKDEFDKTLELLDEVINNCTFDEIEIEKVKSDKLNAIKSEKDVAIKQAVEQYRDMIYHDTPYSISSKVLEKNLPNIKRSDIVEYYNNIFAPKNLIISINGNIDKNKTIKELNKIFNKKSDNNNNNNFDYHSYENKITKTTSPKENILKMETETAWILLGWQVDGTLNQKDYATLQVIDSLLGSGMSSRLFRDLREAEGLAYQLGSGYSPNVLRGSFMLYIGTNPATLEKSKQGLFNEIKRLKTEYVGDKELKEAKEKLLGNYIIGLETNLDKAENIGWYEASGRGYQFKDKYIDLINSVTDADIIEVANKYFNDNYILSIVTK